MDEEEKEIDTDFKMGAEDDVLGGEIPEEIDFGLDEEDPDIDK